MALKIAQMLFMTAMVSFLLVGLFVVGYVIASLLCAFLRNWWPTFGLPYLTPVEEKHESLMDVKRVTLDFMLERRRALMKALHAEHHVNAATINDLMRKPIEIDAESVAKLVSRPTPPRNIKLESHLKEKAEYVLVRFTEGMATPRYLCQKRSERGVGLRVAFAALFDKAIKLDLASAQRLASVLGTDTFVSPANAAARIATRKHDSEAQHATV